MISTGLIAAAIVNVVPSFGKYDFIVYDNRKRFETFFFTRRLRVDGSRCQSPSARDFFDPPRPHNQSSFIKTQFETSGGDSFAGSLIGRSYRVRQEGFARIFRKYIVCITRFGGIEGNKAG